MNVEVCCCVLLWSYLHLGRDHFADTTPATALVFSITSPSAISTMTVVSSAECIKGSLVWEVTQSYVKRAYSIGFNTYAWGNPHAHSCSLMLNWFQTLIWVYVMDPLIQFRVVWGPHRPDWPRPAEGFEPWTSVAVKQVTCMKWLLGFCKPTIFENITKFVFTTLNCCIAAEITVVDIWCVQSMKAFLILPEIHKL